MFHYAFHLHCFSNLLLYAFLYLLFLHILYILPSSMAPAIANAKSCFFMVFSSIFRIIRLFYTICKTPAPLSACIVTHFAA